jgi:hypothetical protein
MYRKDKLKNDPKWSRVKSDIPPHAMYSIPVFLLTCHVVCPYVLSETWQRRTLLIITLNNNNIAHYNPSNTTAIISSMQQGTVHTP